MNRAKQGQVRFIARKFDGKIFRSIYIESDPTKKIDLMSLMGGERRSYDPDEYYTLTEEEHKQIYSCLENIEALKEQQAALGSQIKALEDEINNIYEVRTQGRTEITVGEFNWSDIEHFLTEHSDLVKYKRYPNCVWSITTKNKTMIFRKGEKIAKVNGTLEEAV